MSTVLQEVTARIVVRSAETRERYLQTVRERRSAVRATGRQGLGCANLAHTMAAAPKGDKIMLAEQRAPHIGIVSAYNDMLSAHQPYEAYPAQIKAAARALGATAQVAGGVPAMCDGIT